MKKIRTLSALIWCIGTYSLHAQTNDTMYIHQGQTVIKHAIKDVDSITFYLSEKEEPFLIVDEIPIIATAEGGMYYIAVSSNGEWTAVVENSKSWVTLTINNDTIVVDVDENTFFESRSAAVKITLGSLTKSVVVNQEAKKVDCGEIDCWDFPVKPGMPEWIALPSHQHRVNALQIPDSILLYISTECLADLCSRYPFLGDILAQNTWDDYSEGRIFNEFNGNKELLNREGALAELLKIYDCKIQNLTGHSISVEAFEWLLSFFSRKIGVTKEEYITVLRKLVIGHEKYVDLGLNSGSSGLINYYNRARIILEIGSEGLTGILLQDWHTLYSVRDDIGGRGIRQIYGRIINLLSYELIKEADCGEIDCWDFPVKPGMPEWFALSRLQQLNALQVPDSILPYLSTECLAVICSQYPLLWEIAVNECWPNVAEDGRFNEFNGHGELFKREGAVVELLKIYDYEVLNLTEYITVGHIYQVFGIEWLLSFFSRKLDVTRDEYITVLRSLVTGYEKYVDIDVSRFTIPLNYFNRAHIIFKIGSEGLTGTLLQDWQTLLNQHLLLNLLGCWSGGTAIVRGYGSEINRLSYELIKEADCGEIDCWDFPVKPGTPEWFALSRLQQLNALQIPDSILPYLSTECLAVICSQYPLLYEVTLNDGWGNLIDEMRFNQFNGHGELFKREDAVAELLKIYDCEIQNLVVYDLWGTKQILAIEWLLSLISRKLDVTREEYITVLRSLTTGYEKYVDKGASSYDYNISINFYNRVRIILKIGHEGLTGTLLQDWERINIHDIWWDMGGNSIVRNYGSIINRLSYELIKEADCGEIDCWDFPVKPGMPEWAEVKDRRKALLIPDSILPCLSTECLAVICSQYPLFYDISGYDNWGNLVDEMRFNEFNGHGELFNREGAVVELLKIYDYEIQNLVELTFVMGHMQQVLSIEWLLSFFSRKLDVTRDEYITVLRSLVTGYEKYVDIGAHSYDISLNYYNRARIISKIGSEGLTGTLLRDWQWLNTYNTWWDMGARSLVRDCGSIINQLSYELIK